jgi:hypothetical protein
MKNIKNKNSTRSKNSNKNGIYNINNNIDLYGNYKSKFNTNNLKKKN